MTQTTSPWPTATLAHGATYRCDACGLTDLARYKGYYRETSGSEYVAGRRYAHQAHTPERCAARQSYNARVATERAAFDAKGARAERCTRLVTRYLAAFIVPAIQAGTITTDQANDLYAAAVARWS